jgi:thiol-disulfide isomerase/thioredoxin
MPQKKTAQNRDMQKNEPTPKRGAKRQHAQAARSSDKWSWYLPSLFENDERITLASLDGKPTVVNCFASWCVECERELPEFEATAAEFGDEVDFVFVQSQETSAGAGRDVARDHDLEQFLVARDFGSRNDDLSTNLGARGMLLTAFYDADGNLLTVNRGALVGGQLVQQMQQLGIVS